MNFKIKALDYKEFESLFILTDLELENLNGKRMIVDEKPGYPCRVSLEDAEIGEEVILIPYDFHKTKSPYQSRGPIFIRKGISTKILKKNEIPQMLIHRHLSFRGYDTDGFLKEAITKDGNKTKIVIEQMFENHEIDYIHIHNSGPGCFNCEVRRID